MDWSRSKYNEYYNYYMPWIEDKYLAWFGENKTSYTTKETLKTDITKNPSINTLQSGLADGVGGQFSQGGALNPVGETVSKEGFNRAEHAAPEVQGQQRSWGESMREGAGGIGSAVGGVGRSVGGLVGVGGGGKEEDKEEKGEKGKK